MPANQVAQRESRCPRRRISINSGFGEIIIFDPKQIHFFNANTYYQNNDLSFQISKPDDDWQIRPAYDGLSLKDLTLLESKGYLEGIYLEKENDRRFLILVFDVQSENFQLDDYIENQITSINFKDDIKIPIKQISLSNDWAIFSLDRETNDENSYAEQLLFLKDYRLYMLQYSGKSPENLTELEKSDFNLILDSFEVF